MANQECDDVCVVLVNFGQPLPYYRIDICFGDVENKDLNLNSIPTGFRYQFSNKAEQRQAEQAAIKYCKHVQSYIDRFKEHLFGL